MANNKPKKTVKKSSTKSQTAKTTEKTVTTSAEIKTVAEKNKNPFKGFFAKKFDKDENILTIFKSPKIWGAVAGELIGTMLVAIMLLTLGIYQPLYLMFGLIAITMAVYALSGAHLNPLITASMMATRRTSAIRGVLYIVAQVVGAWLGLLIVNSFRISGGATTELFTMTPLTDKTTWSCIFIELVGAMAIGFFFNRAQSYKTEKGAFTYAALIAGGIVFAILFGIVVSGNFLELKNNFAMNPAMAIMYQIFPTTAENFGALLGNIMLSTTVYILVPMLGGVLGAYLSELSTRLAGENK